MIWCLVFFVDPDDYTALSRRITLDSDTTSATLLIDINDDSLCESDKMFDILLRSLNDNCAVSSAPIPVFIIDDDGELPACDAL